MKFIGLLYFNVSNNKLLTETTKKNLIFSALSFHNNLSWSKTNWCKTYNGQIVITWFCIIIVLYFVYFISLHNYHNLCWLNHKSHVYKMFYQIKNKLPNKSPCLLYVTQCPTVATAKQTRDKHVSSACVCVFIVQLCPLLCTHTHTQSKREKRPAYSEKKSVEDENYFSFCISFFLYLLQVGV